MIVADRVGVLFDVEAVADDAATMAPRSWSDANGIFWSIPKGCSWPSMSIPPMSWIGMGSSSCSTNPPERGCPGCSICGWIRATTDAAKAAIGSRHVVGWTVQVLRAIHRFKRYWVPNDIPQTRLTGPSICRPQVSMCFHGGGSSSEHSPGCSSTGGSVATMSGSALPPARPGSTSP